MDTLDELQDEGMCCAHVVVLARQAQHWFSQYIAVQAFVPGHPSKAERAACIRGMAAAAFHELWAALDLGGEGGYVELSTARVRRGVKHNALRAQGSGLRITDRGRLPQWKIAS